MTAFSIETHLYTGPLDLLLQLIERAELDITALAIAQVTDQFLRHLRALKEAAAEDVSGFLVLAAKMLQIKSEALLPRPVARDAGEEDPGEELARQLIAYKRYKQISTLLAEREARGLRTYLRLATAPVIEAKPDLTEVAIPDLWRAAMRVFAAAPGQPELASVVRRPKVTIREKIRGIVDRLRHAGRARFSDILGDMRSRMDVVVSFLAMLELVKRRRVAVAQGEMFGEIEIVPAEEWDDEGEFELEFGE
jgi:segregation and condensation protein A